MVRLRDSSEGAEDLAGRALAFLASDEERIWRFFELTGLSPGEIREASQRPGFALAVLDHVLSDEDLVLAFAAEAGVDPGAVMRARVRLAGPAADGLREG